MALTRSLPRGSEVMSNVACNGAFRPHPAAFPLNASRSRARRLPSTTIAVIAAKPLSQTYVMAASYLEDAYPRRQTPRRLLGCIPGLFEKIVNQANDKLAGSGNRSCGFFLKKLFFTVNE
jgi:hypothetical protein